MSPVVQPRNTTITMSGVSTGPVGPRANGFATASTNGHSGRRAPFPHIEDLTSVSVDLDPHTPLRKVLEKGDTHMRQAITYNDFRRPDLALQEFIKAFTIAVDKIPKHKDYPSLKSDRGDLARLYEALKTKITNHCATFDNVKEDIKDDNRRSGVQSKRSLAAGADARLPDLPNAPSTLPMHPKAKGSNGTNGAGNGHGNGVLKGPIETGNATTEVSSKPGGHPTTHKTKPAIHPKPQALHGNSIHPDSKPTAQDVASRFARLRGPKETAGQPAAPRSSSETSNAFPSQPRVDTSVPAMPKLPDAIYSPARGTVTSETANLPSSTPRGMFSRTNSIVSAQSSSARNSLDVAVRAPASEQCFPAHSFANAVSSSQAPSERPPERQIPDGTTITPEQLKDLMRAGSDTLRLMLVDIRSREDFDEGHIFAQATICVEPSVLSRANVSAGDIEDSMGIAPDEEMSTFQSRAQFDLIVFYNQSSMSIPERPTTNHEEMALYAFYQALVQFDYPTKPKTPPKLLQGGVEAWVDLFGPQSLQESQAPPVPAHAQARAARQRSKTQVKALAADEIQSWKETAARNRIDYVTSTNDFLRRYPAAGEIRESMTSPQTPRQSLGYGRSPFETELPPAPPARPAPAVPRTSYSGISNRGSSSDVVLVKSAPAASPQGQPTGLINLGQTCYGNALIQAILASPCFAAELTSKRWPTNWIPGCKLPNNKNQTSLGDAQGGKQDPQLMARILGNLLQWLSGGQFGSLKPDTLMRYSRSIHKGYSSEGEGILFFGDKSKQHDASEYLGFIFEQLDKETNGMRGNNDKLEFLQPGEAYKSNKQEVPSPHQLAKMSWERWSSLHASIIDEYWTVVYLNSTLCQTESCKDLTWSFAYGSSLLIPMPSAPESRGFYSLHELFKTYDPRNTLELPHAEGYSCGKGDKNGPHTSKTGRSGLVRLPKLLALRIGREHLGFDMKAIKITTPVKFDIDGLDLSPYLFNEPVEGERSVAGEDRFGNPSRYHLYAVVSHQGRSLHEGHYIAYVRGGPGSTWFRCNDDVVQRMEGSGTQVSERLSNEWFSPKSTFTPVLLFYKREDVEWRAASPAEGMQ